jgi:outer membrane immunogenic protein
MRIKLSTLLIAAAGLVASQSAFAADLPARPIYKAPAAVVAQTWTGFYVGINGGWARSSNCWRFDPATTGEDEGCHHPSGAVAGGQIGYNWQFGSTVLGVEAAGDWASLKGSNISPSFPTDTDQTKVDAIGMFTGRLGWVVWNSTLLYLKGGAAVTHNKYLAFVTTPTAFATTSDTRWGWVAGAGVEYAFAPNWSVAAEYDYLDMGSKTDAFGNFNGGFTCTVTCQEKISQKIHMVTARLNYRFWTGL